MINVATAAVEVFSDGGLIGEQMEVQYRGSGKAYYNDKEYQCDLYYNEQHGGIILKINIKNEVLPLRRTSCT